MPTTAELQADAKSHLSKYFGKAMPTDLEGLVTFFRTNNWVPESDEEKVLLAACAYAMTLLYGSNEVLINRISAGMTVTRAHKDPIRVFVEAIYKTIELGGTKKSRLLSKYTTAIRHLKAIEILPSQVTRLATNPGEGLDKWSRSAAKPKKTQQAATGVRPAIKHSVKFTMKVGREKTIWLISDQKASKSVAASLDKLQAAGAAQKT